MNDVVAGKRADRNEDALDWIAGIGCNLVQDELEIALDSAKASFVIANKVHLVDGDQDVLDPQQRCDVGMAARLDEHAL